MEKEKGKFDALMIYINLSLFWLSKQLVLYWQYWKFFKLTIQLIYNYDYTIKPNIQIVSKQTLKIIINTTNKLIICLTI